MIKGKVYMMKVERLLADRSICITGVSKTKLPKYAPYNGKSKVRYIKENIALIQQPNEK